MAGRFEAVTRPLTPLLAIDSERPDAVGCAPPAAVPCSGGVLQRGRGAMPPHLVYVGTYSDPSSQAGYEVTPERPVMGTTGTEQPRDPLPFPRYRQGDGARRRALNCARLSRG